MNIYAKAPELFRYSTERGGCSRSESADPVTTEVVRNALNSAANQMKNALVRTAFSPIIYEAHDFAVALYDDRKRMLSQAPSLPAFMGTMSFCVEAAVEAVGGVESLKPGDIIIYNQPYGTGSHAQDVAIVAPIFTSDCTLIGYSTNKAHWMDIGASSIYCTNTTDVFQEGVVIPGVKIYDAGKLDTNIQRFIAANSRMPREVLGDMNAQIASARVGVNELNRLVDRFGLDVVRSCIERMFDHGEAIARQTIERIPDGIYCAQAKLDDNGLDRETVYFDLEVKISGSDVCIDFSKAPDANPGPINCPLPSVVSTSRVVVAFLAGCGEAPNEGLFRPLEIVTRPGSMFHPVLAAALLFIWVADRAGHGSHLQGDLQRGARPRAGRGYRRSCRRHELGHPAGRLRLCVQRFATWRSRRKPSRRWRDGVPSGARLFQLASAELMEAKQPLFFHQWEFIPDSAGVGKYRGGLGWNYHYEVTEDVKMVSTVEQTKSPAWGLCGGGEALANLFELIHTDSRIEPMGKVTDMPLPAGTQLRIRSGGGGGYGSPAERGAGARSCRPPPGIDHGVAGTGALSPRICRCVIPAVCVRYPKPPFSWPAWPGRSSLASSRPCCRVMSVMPALMRLSPDTSFPSRSSPPCSAI